MITMFLAFVSMLVYGWGVVRARQRGRRIAWTMWVPFVCGMSSLAVALEGAADTLADASFAWHMVQHLVLVHIAAPLLIVGAPLRVALAALPPRASRRLAKCLHAQIFALCAHPVVAWLVFASVLFASHLSPLYEASLEHPAIHAGEHLLYLGAALLFWNALLGVAPAPFVAPHPLRLLATFLAIPMGAFLGFIFYAASRVTYSHYALMPNALDDQRAAGAVMWLLGGFPFFATFLWLVAAWGARERRYGAILDDVLSSESH